MEVGGNAPEIAHWDGGEWFLSGSEVPEVGYRFEVLSERLGPPGAMAALTPRTLLDIYKGAALIGKQMGVGGRIEIDGRYCKMLVRHPKQRASKTAPDAPPKRASKAPR